MHEKVPLERLGIKGTIDLCALSESGDNLSFKRDLCVADSGHRPNYRQPDFSDLVTFWQGHTP